MVAKGKGTTLVQRVWRRPERRDPYAVSSRLARVAEAFLKQYRLGVMGPGIRRDDDVEP